MSKASTAVVTGAGRGIGRAIALRLAGDGHAVAVSDVDKAAAESVAAEITAAAGKAIAVPTDVTDRDAVFALVEQAGAELGSVDVMVANAGIAHVATLLELRPDDMQRIFDVNVNGVVWCMQAAAERMIAQGGGGKLINAASVAAHTGSANMASYSATKFAVRALTQAAARDLGRHGITVNAYCPGPVDTDMWTGIDEKLAPHMGLSTGQTMAAYSARIPLGRSQTTSDVAGLVSFLAGPDSDFLTGQAIVIDGGIVMS